jgi:hypothetical protein
MIGKATQIVEEQGRELKGVWNQTVEQVQTRFTAVNQDARELVQKVEETGREKLTQITEKLNVEGLVGRLRNAPIVDEGLKRGTETVGRVNATVTEELGNLKVRLDALTQRIESILPARDAVTGAELSAAIGGVSVRLEELGTLTKRLTVLEADLAKLQKAAAKKPVARKAAAKKPVARKSAAKKPVARKAPAKKARR